MIELGLSRITQLLARTPLTWRAIHVAGTNGKGSVCAYVSALLHANNVPCGRFTSPHLIDRWDCITINEKPVKEEIFRDVEEAVKKRNSSENIQASEFELLTATAFEIFNLEKVKIAAIEVGMGGRLDATNILRDPLVTVITKIGLDHREFLGNTLKEIAYQKAGIMKHGVPIVIDPSNHERVLDVIKKYREEVDAGHSWYVWHKDLFPILPNGAAARRLIEAKPQQVTNMGLAAKAVELALRISSLPYDSALTKPTLASVVWPGRLQHLSIESLTGRKEDILVDGAHNPQSAQALSKYVDKTMRTDGKQVTWVIAASRGKDVGEMLKIVLRKGDRVIGTQFGPVDGMPWVVSMTAEGIRVNARKTGLRPRTSRSEDLRLALNLAGGYSQGGPLVVCGSLYLVSDLFRLLRDKSTSNSD